MKKIAQGLLITLLQLSDPCKAAISDVEAVEGFMQMLVSKHQFEYAYVQEILQHAEIKPAILQAISSPAEAIPWYKYRKIFLTDKRIDGGVKFWRDNAATLDAVSAQYGVPAEIIVAIIGVETQYGGNVGSHRVIDALATLGFEYPKRSAFFLSELENFFLLCREEHIDPLQPVGSYAGAMGLPQFMPSSYRHFAVDFEGDKHRDIWKNPADAIASVANYFRQHQWQTGGKIFMPVTAEGDDYQAGFTESLEPNLLGSDLQRLKITSPDALSADAKAKLLRYQQEEHEELWLGLANFYVLTRYNRSPLYAMAVYQLSQAIADKQGKN